VGRQAVAHNRNILDEREETRRGVTAGRDSGALSPSVERSSAPRCLEEKQAVFLSLIERFALS